MAEQLGLYLDLHHHSAVPGTNLNVLTSDNAGVTLRLLEETGIID